MTLERRTYMTPTKAAELAARLMADEQSEPEGERWDYVAVIVDGKNSRAVVRAYDEDGNEVGEL